MGKTHILVIDDEESLRFTFATFLTAAGYVVTTAVNYQEAMSLLAHSGFDLVFASIQLDGGTGVDLLREVKRLGLLCPVILITGAPDVESAAEAVRLGAYDYIPKPITRSTLLRVSRMALTLRALEQEKEKYRLNLETIFNSVKDGIVTVDRDLRIGEINPAACRLVGLTRADVGKSFDDAELDCHRSWVSALRECMETRCPVEIHRLQNVSRGAEGQVISLSISPLTDSRQRHAGAVTMIRDETRLDLLERDLNARIQFQRLTGGTPRMQHIYQVIEALADIETTALVTGESGTGKELVAEAIHFAGNRSKKPLVKVNCSALMENLLESELFGHVRGAFTGAIKDKIGRFQKADGGTLFLDEIGDLSPAMQVKLLRVLQEKEFERVGDSTPIKVNVRIIAATNRNLTAKVREGTFRQDLYYRLNVMNIHLPPLRERAADIPLLTESFIDKFCRQFDKNIKGVAPEVMERFLAYPWPGNIRQLEHAIEHAFILCPGAIIGPEHLSPEILSWILPPSVQAAKAPAGEEIRSALARAGGNKAKAARLLGISRKTLYRKLERLRLAGADD